MTVTLGHAKRETVVLRITRYDPVVDALVPSLVPLAISRGVETVRVPVSTDGGIGTLDMTDSGERDSDGRRIFA